MTFEPVNGVRELVRRTLLAETANAKCDELRDFASNPDLPPSMRAECVAAAARLRDYAIAADPFGRGLVFGPSDNCQN